MAIYLLSGFKVYKKIKGAGNGDLDTGLGRNTCVNC